MLGAYHGLNPAMGWLFALALGLQEQRRNAILQALPSIALGHAVSIVLAVLVIGIAQVIVSLDAPRYAGAGVLILFGLYKLVRRKHFQLVGFKDLMAWSFLMATAHGAGLMLVPVVLRLSEPMQGSYDQGAHAAHPARVVRQRCLSALRRPDFTPFRCS